MATLQQALTTSDYRTAQIEYNGLYTCVDGSSQNGYDVSTGVQGLSASSWTHVASMNDVVSIIKNRDLDTDGWVPIGEDGEPQES